MLENHVDATPGGQFAHPTFESLGLVVDDVVRPEGCRFRGLLVTSHSRDNRGTSRLRELYRGATDAAAACMHENGFARLQLGIVKQHVFDRAECDRGHRRRL